LKTQELRCSLATLAEAVLIDMRGKDGYPEYVAWCENVLVRVGGPMIFCGSCPLLREEL